MDEQAQWDTDQYNRKTEQNVGRAAEMAVLVQDYLQFQTQSFKDISNNPSIRKPIRPSTNRCR